MAVRKATDAELRILIHANEKVVVKFTKKDCVICERMGVTYSRLSEEKEFKDITFLLMDAIENPVSAKEVHLTGTPFFAIYQKGFLTKCKLISVEDELIDFLHELLSNSHNFKTSYPV
ncbi:thioredoxin family protein [Adhaeribacter sp. BT258]|uniref:Thioredoxin family protein n=1 Tax=Adhaeribacter terrigena TaxID=2793070 RepID=A0ABS1C394_9BACT|nr:thioredoxin family protein [Adhaeribacter terrigena]MBK0403611.1 thioredoxin family protein [Adhaeribacter terrigena]